MSENKIIYVYFDGGKPINIGRLYVSYIRGEEQFSFEYTDGFFSSEIADYFFDADIYPYKGRQFLLSDKALFGVFSDSAPDRWGRLLMRRRENILANSEARKPKKLYESDYLIGVYDEARMGALRFSLSADGDFLSNEKEQAIPPFENLRSLEEASREFEKDENLLNGKWLKQLIAPGSSLGGARPKATVKGRRRKSVGGKIPVEKRRIRYRRVGKNCAGFSSAQRFKRYSYAAYQIFKAREYVSFKAFR